jgi:EmrB/QacA subfamily drug resistance transporter
VIKNLRAANLFRQPCDEGVIRSERVATPCPARSGRWVLAATIIGSSMVFIDGTVVNVALPVLQRELNATVADVQWVVESYALFLSALILVGGSLGDLYGRRRVFAIGVGIFAVASAWCGLAADPIQLIIARAVQGIGGALLVPGSLAIISACFGDEQRGRAIGIWSGASAMTTALGPVLGGWLVEHVSWRLVFFINIPLALVVIAILYLRVPESRAETRAGGLDWWGALLVTIGLGGTVFGLIESPEFGWTHPLVLGSLAVGIISLILFVAVEARSASPMVPLSLFRSRSFSGANLLTLFLYAALGGSLFFLPFNLIQVQGYSPTAAGAVFLPFVLIMFLLSRWAGGLVDRHGARLPLIVGPIIAACGFALFAIPEIGGSYWTTFFPAILIMGLGMAISVAPLTTAVMNSVPSERAGVASGVNNAASRVASLLSIAVLGIVVLNVFNHELDERVRLLDLPDQTRQALDQERIKLAGADIPPEIAGERKVRLRTAINEAFVSGFRIVMIIAAILALISSLVAALMIEGKKPVRAVEPEAPG